MNTKIDTTALANTNKRLDKKNQQRRELDALALEDIFAFNEHVKENWQYAHQVKDQIQKTLPFVQIEKTMSATVISQEVQLQKAPHLLAAAQSFEEMNDQHIRQQLKKQLLHDYELGEHIFEINIQDLGSISVNAYIKENAWHFALNAEQNHTKNWLVVQQQSLKNALIQENKKQQALNISLSII